MENRKVEKMTYEVNIEYDNTKIFMSTLYTLDPELWLIKQYLDRYNINGALIPVYIEQLFRINEGSGWGRVLTEVKDHKVTFCDGTDSRLLDLEIKKQ